jgi:hypothetical protein
MHIILRRKFSGKRFLAIRRETRQGPHTPKHFMEGIMITLYAHHPG